MTCPELVKLMRSVANNWICYVPQRKYSNISLGAALVRALMLDQVLRLLSRYLCTTLKDRECNSIEWIGWLFGVGPHLRKRRFRYSMSGLFQDARI